MADDKRYMGFWIGHLHEGERNRIQEGSLTPQEREMLAKGEDPWAKFRGPLPPSIPAYVPPKKTDSTATSSKDVFDLADLIDQAKNIQETAKDQEARHLAIFNLAKGFAAYLNSEEMQRARDYAQEGLRKFAESLHASDKSLKQQIDEFAKSGSYPQAFNFSETDAAWATKLSEREDARVKAIVAETIEEALNRRDERERNQREMESMGRRHGFTPVDNLYRPKRPEPPEDRSSKPHWFETGIGDARLWGIVAVFAVAIAFSRRSANSDMAVWVCLVLAAVLVVFIVNTHRDVRASQYRRLWTGVAVLVTIPFVVIAGNWLTAPSPNLLSLKQRAQELSRDLLDFVGERERNNPSYEMRDYQHVNEEQRNIEWQRYTERLVQYSSETNREYETRFAPKVLAIKNEFATLGMEDKDLNVYAEHPTNPIGMRAIAVRIGFLAEQLP